MKVVLISGKAESGKNFVSNMLKDKLKDKECRVLEIAFADYLKFICSKYLGWDGVKDEYGRNLLQYTGTEVCRKYDKKFFSSKVAELLILFQNSFDIALVTDLRFPDELSDIGTIFDTVTVRVNRPEQKNHLTNEQNQHESEVLMDNFEFDFTITNNKELERQVDSLVEELWRK